MFDDIDMMIMQHTMVDENVKATAGGAVGKGFINKATADFMITSCFMNSDYQHEVINFKRNIEERAETL